jgi:hypothetical protein
VTEGYQPMNPAAGPTPMGLMPGMAPPPPKRVGSAALASVVFVAMLVLCLGGGAISFLVVQSLEPRGTATPESALEGFLRSVFVEKDANRAADFVCVANRDDKELARLVFEVRAFASRYASANPRWSYPSVERTGKREARADVTLTLSTVDQPVSKKQVGLLLIDHNGWWVCEVEAAR